MPQSLSKVIIHIIFSTKNREPWLDLDIAANSFPAPATCAKLQSSAAWHPLIAIAALYAGNAPSSGDDALSAAASTWPR